MLQCGSNNLDNAMSTIKVFGHQSPDTDATCAPIVWAWFVNNYRDDQATAYVLGEPNTEAQFVLKRWGQAVPPVLEQIIEGEEVAIVDTNNSQELFDNINDANIVSIIDHHKLTGGLETASPLEIHIEPVACTMTVMYSIMDVAVDDLPEHIAGLMLSGIISDTLEFRSPTTTEKDKRLAEELAERLGVIIPEYASEMFEAKSDISAFTDAELLRMDSKKYQVADTNFRVSVLETTNPGMVLERKGSLVKAMDTVAQEDEVDQVLLFVVDILKEEATLLVPNDTVKQLAEASFGVEVSGDTVLLDGVVSRKKQIIPVLTLS